MDKKFKDFSLKPDVLKKGPDGLTVDRNATDHYLKFQTITNGHIYYTPKSNRYWLNPGAEASEADMENYLPFLRWKYDEFVKETKLTEVEDDKGKKVKMELETGKMINKFPPSVKNIAKKRAELAAESAKNYLDFDIDAIINLTSPHSMVEKDSMQAKLGENLSREDYWARKLTR